MHLSVRGGPRVASSTKGIRPHSLISAEFSSHTLAGLKDAIDGSRLNYYIHESDGYVALDYGSRAYSVGHSDADIAFINDLFLRLDPLIELDFERQGTWDGTLLDIYSIDWHNEWEDDIVGQVFDQGAYERSYWDVLWRDTDGESDLSGFDASTIVHEIGHSLGLSHPEEDPYNEAWNTTDTVMSYNEGANGWDAWFSVADIEALQLIWGLERGRTIYSDASDDQGSPVTETGFDYIGTKRADELTGSNRDDTFEALGGNDLIYARGGDDIIRAGKGKDFAWGGDGSDLFILDQKDKKARKGIDYIMDFQPGVDAITIEGSTKGYTLSIYEDSSYISKGSKVVAWIDGVIDVDWTSAQSLA